MLSEYGRTLGFVRSSGHNPGLVNAPVVDASVENMTMVPHDAPPREHRTRNSQKSALQFGSVKSSRTGDTKTLNAISTVFPGKVKQTYRCAFVVYSSLGRMSLNHPVSVNLD